jgi:dTDP-4-dehydrorhamnose reductase
MIKKILLIGGDEILGERLSEYLTTNTNYDLYVVTPDEKLDGTANLNYTDITDREKLKELCFALKPDYVVNVCEVSNIEECEEDKKKASDFNLILSQNLVRIANIVDAKYVGVSSDMIFDGTVGFYKEDARPEPVNYYGKTKHAAENMIRSENIPWAIIRTSMPFGFSKYSKKDELFEIIEKLERGETVLASEKVTRTPIFSEDLAEAIARMIDREKTGIYNISGNDIFDAYHFASSVAEIFGYDRNLVQKTDKINELIPRKCGLNCAKAIKELDLNMPSALSAMDSIAFLYKQYKVLEKK